MHFRTKDLLLCAAVAVTAHPHLTTPSVGIATGHDELAANNTAQPSSGAYGRTLGRNEEMEGKDAFSPHHGRVYETVK